MKKLFYLPILVTLLFASSLRAQNFTTVKTLLSRVTDSTAVTPAGWGALRYNAQRASPAWQFWNGASWELFGSGGVSLSANNTWTGNNAFRNATRTETGTTYTIQASDEGLNIHFTNALPITVTFPNGLAQYFNCAVIKAGVGNVNIVATGTLNSAGTSITTLYTGASVTHLGSNVWLAIGAFGSGGGSGDVVGPASSVNNNVAFFDGVTGKLIKDSGLTLSGSNNGDVSLAGTPDYITISGQTITRGLVDLANDVTGLVPVANGGTGTATPSIVAGTNITVTGTWPNQTINSTGGGGGGITIGTTTITGGTNTRVLYNNSGIVGEYPALGSGSVVMGTHTSPNSLLFDGSLTFTADGQYHTRVAPVATAGTNTAHLQAIAGIGGTINAGANSQVLRGLVINTAYSFGGFSVPSYSNLGLDIRDGGTANGGFKFYTDAFTNSTNAFQIISRTGVTTMEAGVDSGSGYISTNSGKNFTLQIGGGALWRTTIGGSRILETGTVTLDASRTVFGPAWSGTSTTSTATQQSSNSSLGFQGRGWNGSSAVTTYLYDNFTASTATNLLFNQTRKFWNGTTANDIWNITSTGLMFLGGGTEPTSVLDLSASTTGRASLRLRPGTAPTTPNDGEVWSTTTGLFSRINGVTYDLTAGGGATNLGFTPSATDGIVTSDTGTDATIPLGNGTNSGLSLNDYTTAEKNKLAAISGTNTGDQTITLTSDVTGSGTGSFATTIANDAVTYAKMQNVSTASKLIGRGDSGSGDPQEITIGSGLTMTGTTLSVQTYYAPNTLVGNATDANFTATANGIHNILDGVATANRVITIPTGSNGDVMKFYNTEDTRVWSFTGATVYLADRVTVVTQLDYNYPCFMEKIDGLWIITN
jgi:hypothetical protein